MIEAIATKEKIEQLKTLMRDLHADTAAGQLKIGEDIMIAIQSKLFEVKEGDDINMAIVTFSVAAGILMALQASDEGQLQSAVEGSTVFVKHLARLSYYKKGKRKRNRALN